MSAVEEYRRHTENHDQHGHSDRVDRRCADAAIAELEAELDQAREKNGENYDRAEQAEAERDAWKEQRDAEYEAWAGEFKKREQAEAEVKRLRHFNQLAIDLDATKTARIVELEFQTCTQSNEDRIAELDALAAKWKWQRDEAIADGPGYFPKDTLERRWAERTTR